MATTYGVTDQDNYADIADSIRAKNGSSNTYTPGDMAAAIRSLPSGGGAEVEEVSEDCNLWDLDKNKFYILLPDVTLTYGTNKTMVSEEGLILLYVSPNANGIIDYVANCNEDIVVDNTTHTNGSIIYGWCVLNDHSDCSATVMDYSMVISADMRISTVMTLIGQLRSLHTQNKTNLVSAINEVNDKAISAGKEVYIGSTEPTDPDVKLWINTGEVQNLGSEVHIGDTIDSKIGLNILVGKNLIDLSSMLISGGYSDTGFVASTNYLTIQYIQVRPNTTYTLSTNLSLSKYTALRIVDFSSNKTFIRRSGGTALASANTFTTSSDAYYLALCFYTGSTASTSDITQAQLEKGSTATTYEAYITPTINVDGEDIYVKGQNDFYSTAEQVIGTWIDGKPIYRRVISTTLTTGAPIANISNINIRSISGIVKRGTQEWNINTIYPNDSTICCSTFYDENSGDLFAVYGTGFTSGSKINVILEYTKTTD